MQPPKKRTRINDEIRVPEVLVIGPNNDKLGQMSVMEALRIATDSGLDLVEVAPEARPPVCRIMDYGKFKYEQKKKEQSARKHQSVVQIKEVKLRPKTDTHDVEVVINKVLRFLEQGDKTKVTVMFRGREIAFQEYGMRQLDRVVAAIGDLGVIEQAPRIEGRNLWMMVAPNPNRPKPAAPAKKETKPEEKPAENEMPNHPHPASGEGHQGD